MSDREGLSYSLDGASESKEPEFRGRDTFSYKSECTWFLSWESNSSHSRSLGSKDTQSYKTGNGPVDSYTILKITRIKTRKHDNVLLFWMVG